MSTPIIEAIDNVNQSSLETVFAAVAADPTAQDNLSQSDRNIDAMSTSVGAVTGLDTNGEAVLKVLCRREGRNPANFADLNAVAADVSFVQDLSVRKVATDIIKKSFKAENAISANDRATREMICHPAGLDATTFTDVAAVLSDNAALTTITTNAQARRAMIAAAMQEVAASQTAMQELAALQTAMQDLTSSRVAVQRVVTSQTAMQELAASQIAMQEVAGSQTVMKEVIGSPTALQVVANSQTAMQEVANSQTAMQEVANSQTAMQEVASSQTAMDEIGNNAIVQNTVYNNNTAISALSASNLASFATASPRRQSGATLKSDRTILITHNPGGEGARSNQPVFTTSSNDLPQTADQIRRNNTRPNLTNSRTTTNATFIDIVDS